MYIKKSFIYTFLTTVRKGHYIFNKDYSNILIITIITNFAIIIFILVTINITIIYQIHIIMYFNLLFKNLMLKICI